MKRLEDILSRLQVEQKILVSQNYISFTDFVLRKKLNLENDWTVDTILDY